MMILIDGDACGVINVTERLAKEMNIPCHIYCDTSRMLESSYSEIHIVDKGRDSADFAIINKCTSNDIVITNDSGLATMVLAKNGIAINAKGFEYTTHNIMSYLTKRYIRQHESKKLNRNQVHGMNMRDKTRPRNDYKQTLQRAIDRTERSKKLEENLLP